MYPLAEFGRLAVVVERFLTRGGTLTKMDFKGVPVPFALQGRARTRASVVPPLRVVLQQRRGPGPPVGVDQSRPRGASWLRLRFSFSFLISTFCLSLICLYSASETWHPALQRAGLCPVRGRVQFPALKSLQKAGSRSSFTISLFVLSPPP